MNKQPTKMIHMYNYNRNNLNYMKKGVKKPSNRLIVDEFQKIKKSQIQPTSKSSNSNQQKGPYMKFKVEEIACRFCNKYIPEQNIMYHQKVCQSRHQEGENYYDMIYSRPQHHHRVKPTQGDRIGANEEREENDDYYPISRKQQIPQEEKIIGNKPKRPMSAMNKKTELKPKSSVKVEEKQVKLKKATSTSKFKNEVLNYCPASKEKQKNKQLSRHQQVYIKNAVQKKQPLSLNSISQASKLKKKNLNMAQRFQNEDRSFEERSLRRPDSHSKKQERPNIRQKVNHEQQMDQEMLRKKHKEQIVREKLREDREVERQRRREPAEPIRREPRREQPQPRQPIRTQVRNDRQTERQPRSNRNQSRNQNFQRQRNRPAGRNPRLIPPEANNFLNLVSRTINNQLEMMNNQFAAMSNIFQNFSNFVNINIDSHPNYYQFTTHEFNSSSDQDSFDSDSSNSFSSSYDDYYEEDEEAEGMDEEQLNSIQNKRCTICLMELRNGDVIKQLYCDHLFHAECIEEWLRRKSACPVCRDQLGPN